MNHSLLIRCGAAALIASALLLLPSGKLRSDPVYFAGTPATIAQVPLYLKDAVPPLNMLVMGKDHKIYYEAYNDASDLNGDGVLDVGYKPATIDYYGYFNSNVCYTYESTNGGRFTPSSVATNKQCSGKWSGDFLNYLTTSRMDALRRVLYGGWRQVDTASDTTLQGAFFPQDAHSWGKEYRSVARDGYDISKYAPLSVPTSGKYHLFAVTTVTGNDQAFPNYTAPLFRVMTNSTARIWEWVSIEGPVAGNKCYNQGTDCLSGTNNWSVVPALAFEDLQITTWKRTSGSGSPGDVAAMDKLFTDYAVNPNRCGTKAVGNIDQAGTGINPFNGTNGCGQDNYLTRFDGKLVIPSDGNYSFAIDGDDAVELWIDGKRVVGWYGGHAGDRSTGGLDSHSATVYLSAGTYTVAFRHQEGAGGEAWGLFWKPASGANTRTDYNVRVQVCGTNAALRDGSCKVYPNGNAKPTGILHDYGENQKMYFGLITGSQFNNLEGGVLRRNVSDFANEISASDGTFKPGTGIANALSKLRMIGGGYAGSTTNNLNSNSNWNWANGTGNCPSVGDRAIVNGECRMWGNPIAEMMFEGMRYFAGAKAPTARFATGGASQGRSEETTMGLSQETWKDPYDSSDGYPTCAKPYQTVISDINPSYDSDLPGSAFATIAADGTVPGFSAGGEGQAIWNHEFGAGARSVFIGDVAGTTDGAPTAKSAASFGNIRGLAPEEPTKQGTYYAASVARYGYMTDLNSATDQQKMGVYSIALASPLPRIEFPVNGRTITLLPFAKTASGTFGGGTRKPTNTIVDFYVEQIENLDPSQPKNMTVNNGMPYAVFRINYEDVEQGNDHDMDAIVKYTIMANANGTVTVKLDSEYAAGSADQNIGYVLSGTTKDGIYLDVRDTDSTAGSFQRYDLNTPQDKDPGGCKGVTTGSCNQQLPLTSNRTFTPSATAASATELRNPLWYAAKYGGFKDANGNNLPDTGEWDSNVAGQPDNYFLVTNPLQLRSQLTKAFDSIADRDLDVGVATISGARVGNSSFTLQPTYKRSRNGKDWTGNLSAIAVNPNGTLGASLWNAQANLTGTRKIFTVTAPGSGTKATTTAVAFDSATPGNLGASAAAQYDALGITPATVAAQYGASYTPADFIAYLSGDQSREASKGGAGNTLRTRSGVLGDIVNSEPVIDSPRSNYGYGYYSGSMFSGYATPSGYLNSKSTRKTVAYVGANDGMLHAFDASTQPCAAPNGNLACAKAGAGKELFAFIPNGVLDQMGKLALPDAKYDHRYYVDGQIAVGDAKDGSTWKTVLVGSAGGGGRSVFALDVSDPSSFGTSKVLWERNARVDLDIGNVYGKPMLVPLENDKWGVLFGNGYGGNSSDPSLYILDAFSGAVIKKITANDGNQASTSLLPLLDFICSAISAIPPINAVCARKTDPYNGLGQITAIDKNGNGKVDTVYGGDLQGNLWKFDLADASATNWKVANSGAALFTAVTGSERQPITGGIRVAAGPGSGVMVYFGTGRYFVTGDNDVPATPQVQSLYGIFDNGTAVASGRASLVAQTIESQTTASGFTTRDLSTAQVFYYGTNPKRGWYIDLKIKTNTNGSGERFIATPLIQSGRVFFATYEPSKNSCDPGGTNFQYGLDLLSGAGALANVQVLPSGTAACTGAACGGVAIGGGPDNGGAQPPVMGTGVATISPLQQIDKTCDPTKESCATFEQCQVVIYPGGFVLPRPCGRQSWRQLK
ncbi:PilC/PilY family type IV pilus protein [Luteimonas mephitis]|uniref:PilC/PilY family type IV pilus protein n=1 Tax=Luteimonas mephitis TaxID=83615 RepID=UPI003A9271DF